MAAQFSWYSWVVLLHDRIYILDENKIYELVFLLKLKTDASTKLHSHEYAKIPQAMKIAPPPFPQNLNDSTVFVRVLRQKKSRLCYLSSLFLIVIQHWTIHKSDRQVLGKLVVNKIDQSCSPKYEFASYNNLLLEKEKPVRFSIKIWIFSYVWVIFFSSS